MNVVVAEGRRHRREKKGPKEKKVTKLNRPKYEGKKGTTK